MGLFGINGTTWDHLGLSLINIYYSEHVLIISYILQGAKASVAFALLVGLIPLMFGLLLEVVALMPARVPLNQSPVFFLWQDWALGAMYTKITIALTFMGPDWWLKRAIEQLYQVKLALNLSKLV